MSGDSRSIARVSVKRAKEDSSASALSRAILVTIEGAVSFSIAHSGVEIRTFTRSECCMSWLVVRRCDGLVFCTGCLENVEWIDFTTYAATRPLHRLTFSDRIDDEVVGLTFAKDLAMFLEELLAFTPFARDPLETTVRAAELAALLQDELLEETHGESLLQWDCGVDFERERLAVNSAGRYSLSPDSVL